MIDLHGSSECIYRKRNVRAAKMNIREYASDERKRRKQSYRQTWQEKKKWRILFTSVNENTHDIQKWAHTVISNLCIEVVSNEE